MRSTFERTEEQKEELGLLDMNVDNYGTHYNEGDLAIDNSINEDVVLSAAAMTAMTACTVNDVPAASGTVPPQGSTGEDGI